VLSQAKSIKTGKPLGDGTKAQILHAISAVFEHAIEMGYRATKTTETYVHKIENPNVTRAAVEAMAGVEHSWNTEPGTAGSGGE
jgi:hypothetical protein